MRRGYHSFRSGAVGVPVGERNVAFFATFAVVWKIVLVALVFGSVACGGSPEVIAVEPLPPAQAQQQQHAVPVSTVALQNQDATGSTYEVTPPADSLSAPPSHSAASPTIGAPTSPSAPAPPPASTREAAPAAPAAASSNLAAFDACRGTISRARAQRAISGVESELAQCYATGFERDNSQRGDIRLVLKIERNGRMSEGAASGDITDRGILDCMLDTLRAVRFPRPRRGCATVMQTYSFNPH